MRNELECPVCDKHYVAYDTSSFRCSRCGAVVDVQMASWGYQLKVAEERQKRAQGARLVKGSPLLIPLVLGAFFHELSFIAAFVFAGSLVWLLIEFKKRSQLELAKFVTICTLLFVVGGIAGDSLWPPTALCNDYMYSYSEHHSGTCSWHGGVSEWNPDPWWKRVFTQ